MHEGHGDSSHPSSCQAVWQGPSTLPTVKRKAAPAQRNGRLVKQRVVPATLAGAAPAASVVSGNASSIKTFNTSLSGKSLWAEIADQAGIDNSVNVGRLDDRITWTSTHVVRGGAAFSIKKLTKALGKVVCLPVAIGTSAKAELNVVFCGDRGKAGHEHDGAAHAGLEKWAKAFNDRATGPAYRAGFA